MAVSSSVRRRRTTEWKGASGLLASCEARRSAFTSCAGAGGTVASGWAMWLQGRHTAWERKLGKEEGGE